MLRKIIASLRRSNPRPATAFGVMSLGFWDQGLRTAPIRRPIESCVSLSLSHTHEVADTRPKQRGRAFALRQRLTLTASMTMLAIQASWQGRGAAGQGRVRLDGHTSRSWERAKRRGRGGGTTAPPARPPRGSSSCRWVFSTLVPASRYSATA